jgi:hypothetical protein
MSLRHVEVASARQAEPPKSSVVLVNLGSSFILSGIPRSELETVRTGLALAARLCENLIYRLALVDYDQSGRKKPD